MFSISSSNAPPALKMQKSILDQSSNFIEMAIIRTLLDAMLSGRDFRLNALLLSRLNDSVAVIAAIGQKMLCWKVLDQVLSLGTVSTGTFSNNDSKWHTMGIHGQMNFARDPPFVLLIS